MVGSIEWLRKGGIVLSFCHKIVGFTIVALVDGWVRWWWPSLGFDAFGGGQALALMPWLTVGCVGGGQAFLGFDALVDGWVRLWLPSIEWLRKGGIVLSFCHKIVGFTIVALVDGWVRW